MKAAADPDKDAAEAVAARFVAKLCAGEMSQRDLQALADWLAENPRHVDEYEAILDTWDAVGACRDSLAASPVTPPGIDPAAAARKRSGMTRYRLAAGFAALVIAVAATYFDWDRDRNREHANVQTQLAHETAVGERDIISLADGSAVTLNTETRLIVNFSGGNRRLVLEFGEAFFDIAHDPSNPLTVEAGDRVISVLGTTFNVHRNDSGVAVAVIEGLVSVGRLAAVTANDSGAAGQVAVEKRAKPDAILLSEGSGATFSGRGAEIAPLSRQAMERSQDWRLGIVKFDNEPLSAVISELNRYGTRRIVIEDATIADWPVSGVFRLDDIGEILRGIELAMPVEITRHSDRYVLVEREVRRPSGGETGSNGPGT